MSSLDGRLGADERPVAKKLPATFTGGGLVASPPVLAVRRRLGGRLSFGTVSPAGRLPSRLLRRGMARERQKNCQHGKH